MKKTIYILYSIMFLSCAVASAQNKGYVSASLESTNHFYVDDKGNYFYKESLPQLGEGDFYASNDYIKVDYYNGRLSAGTQLESYLPRLVGYPENLNQITLSNLYVSWTDKSYSVNAASVLAKTHRDEYMMRIAEEYPMYGWAKNKGYPTREHRIAVREYGLSPYHRKSFNTSPEQLELF